MSTGTISTGTTLSSTSACDERPDACVFFDSVQTDLCSHVFTVDEDTGLLQVMAFDLPAGDIVYLQQVYGDNEGSHFADVLVNGSRVRADASNNRFLVPFAGRFRLRYEGTPGTAVVVCEPTDCCHAPLFPQQESDVAQVQVTNAFGVNLFQGDPNV